MADKFNKNSSSDDINEFFAEFDKVDEAADPQPQKPQTPEKPKNPESEPTPAPSRTARAAENSRAKRSKEKAASEASSKKSKKKGKKKEKKPMSKKKKVFTIIGLAILALILIGVIYVGALILTAGTHSIDADNIYTRLYQRSTIYDDEGKEIESVFSEEGNRANVAYEDLPENLVNAIVAIEDKTFWKHHGFNFVRIMGAIKDSVFRGGQISGTSTLSQQLARNVYLSETKSKRSLNRKILEAYYTVLIEKSMSKEQIVEAYLNTIYLGFNCYGVESASQAYFGKSVKKLDLLECAALASLPQSPDAFALVKSYPVGTVEVEKKNILAETDSIVYAYNGDLSSDRRKATLRNMVDQGYITQAEADKALDENLKKSMKISADKGSGFSSYFTDYAIDQITADIMEEYGWPKSEAREFIYRRGLKIYTTMNKSAQKIAEKEFEKSSHFPRVTNVRKDGDGNILNSKTGKIVLYDYDDYFNSKDQFVLKKNEYKKNSDGSITIYKDKRLKFFDITVSGKSDIGLTFKPMYQQKDGKYYTIEDGAISVPQGYKSKDASGNCIISAKFFKDYPKFFKEKDGKLIVSSENCALKQKVVQPQAAIVIMDYKTGGVKAMVGGRGTEGKQIYNRAVQPRQPGSSIKPIAIYSSALQSSYNAAEKGESMSLSNSDGSNWGKYITAGSVINDAPMVVNGRTWPKNWYTGYRGHMTLRSAVQQSVNVCAVKVYQQMGPEFPTSQLKKMGVTTLVEDGNTNDMNPAALALGGMTRGIKPIEMAAAYGIFPNEGTYTEPVAYTKITNSNDEVLFDKTPKTEQVLDKGVAFIMTDILRSVVTNGLGSNASFSGQPVAGKTGTTSDNFDAWFVGFTPQYTASVWIGNDVNIELAEGSAAAARLWRTIMSQVCAGEPRGKYPSQPDDVSKIGGEYYTDGTYSRVAKPKSTSDESESSSSSDKKKGTTKQVERATTQPPATQAPTTKAPTTQAPTTKAPTTNTENNGD
ncbi:transglycosylase domain-containing protein [Hominibacterium faecale]|uniref:transglycosylase domain-containing protein n=1 Tax=Hominibacterium faecale TaxID=2839743 RepID=UPI0011DD54D0|nr:transglycosylase domain-containing protein [Hominibacterium faecale]